MQKVRYVNPVGGSILFAAGPPYIFESVTGVNAVESRLITTSSPGQDGNNLHDVYLSDREITVKFHVFAPTRGTMYQYRRMAGTVLSAKANAGGRLGRLEYINDTGVFWIPAAVKIGPQADERHGNFNHCSTVFYCPDPYWRANNPVVSTLTYSKGGFEFPLEIDHKSGFELGQRGYQSSITMAGDSDAPIYAEIYGPAETPKITNSLTGEYIRVGKSLAEGDKLVVSTQPGNIEVYIIRNNGAQESAYGYLDLSSTFFTLPPGENFLEYSSGDDTAAAKIILTAYSRYGGV